MRRVLDNAAHRLTEYLSRRHNVSNLNIRKVAVLGAGVMGAQIAAHLINAQVPVLLFDLPAKEGPKNGIALKAIENLKKLSPAPFGVKDDEIGRAHV